MSFLKPTTLLFTAFFILCACSCNDEPEPGGPSSGHPTTAVTLEYPAYYGSPLNNQDQNISEEGVTLGRLLFYDEILSWDQTISCATCHQQKYSFSDSTAFSSGSFGNMTDRSSMAFSNLVWQNEFFWDGRSSTLEDQAKGPIESSSEMNLPMSLALMRLNNDNEYPGLFYEAYGDSTVSEENLLNAIAQFEKTLISDNSKFDQYRRGETILTDDEAEGLRLFTTHPQALNPNPLTRGANCSDCHSLPLGIDQLYHNVGLDSISTDHGRENVTGSVNDRAKFKTVSLRNIELSAPYMHDGRFASLEEVLDHYSDHVKSSATLDPLIATANNNLGGTQLELTETEKAQVIAFLKTLTDNDFITNEAFSDPDN